jgi:hypothetical protein
MKMETTCSSETSVDFQRTARHYIIGDRTLHNHSCANLKSYIVTLINERISSFFNNFSQDQEFPKDEQSLILIRSVCC